jgi:hypothetical protein
MLRKLAQYMVEPKKCKTVAVHIFLTMVNAKHLKQLQWFSINFTPENKRDEENTYCYTGYDCCRYCGAGKFYGRPYHL